MNALDTRKLVAEAVGTALLVFFAVGVATLSFGFKFAGTSMSAGVVATALAFGLVLLALAYALGPISGCHINPAVTMGFVVTRRMGLVEGLAYWAAQLAGGIVGALVLWGMFETSPVYSRTRQGLGADGFGKLSMIKINTGGAVIAEILLTFLFVFTVLSVTRAAAPPLVAGASLGLALTVVHLVGIPITGTSVNPARSLGPALVVGGLALSQLWLFLVMPLVGGAVAGLFHQYLFPAAADVQREIVMPDVAEAREQARQARERELEGEPVTAGTTAKEPAGSRPATRSTSTSTTRRTSSGRSTGSSSGGGPSGRGRGSGS